MMQNKVHTSIPSKLCTNQEHTFEPIFTVYVDKEVSYYCKSKFSDSIYLYTVKL